MTLYEEIRWQIDAAISAVADGYYFSDAPSAYDEYIDNTTRAILAVIEEG